MVRSFSLRVDTLRAQINAKFGSFEGVPVHHLDQKFTQEELLPLYVIADVVLDTALRDVTSTTAYEFFCTQALFRELHESDT